MEHELEYLIHLNSAVWLFPPIRQSKTKFFFFFSMMGVSHIAAYIIYFFFMPNMYLPFIITLYLGALSFIETKYLKNSWHPFTVILVLLVLGFLVTDRWKNHAMLLGLVELFLSGMFIHLFMLDFLKRRFNVFIIMLLTYFFINIFNVVLLLLFDYQDIYMHYYFSDFVEFLIGVFFIIFRADNDRLAIKL
jgi:hypothetical protein